ncbi:hypothetical protein V8J82_11295 [Gymnodinialimonas sp. 2305UL16-5]
MSSLICKDMEDQELVAKLLQGLSDVKRGRFTERTILDIGKGYVAE